MIVAFVFVSGIYRILLRMVTEFLIGWWVRICNMIMKGVWKEFLMHGFSLLGRRGLIVFLL